MMREALLYEKLPDNRVRCHTCQRRCIIPEGERGWCKTRIHTGGVISTLVYGEVSSLSINPIEKKPVFHFFPGTRWLSLGTWGCNFRCPGCQNWEIAHWLGEGLGEHSHLTVAEQVGLALDRGCVGLSWTFNEPTLWLEYTLEAAKLAKMKGLFTNYVTNGFLTQEALSLILPYLDVYRVDIKGFSVKTYQALAGLTEYAGILEVAERAKHSGLHVEVVTNVIPHYNDDEEELSAIARWIRDKLGPDTPWHVTRFHPALRLSRHSPTPISTLERARAVGMKIGLWYVYLGNVPGHPGENTYCHSCRSLLIRRSVFDVIENRIKGGRCPDCGETIPGKFPDEASG